jgi:hypothetical protein
MAPLYEQNTLHIDAALTDFAIGYGQDPANFIGERIAPSLNVSNISDSYWIGGKEAFNVPNVKRVAGALFPRVNLQRSTDRYSCEGYGVEVAVTREEVAMADAALTPEQDATQTAVETLRLNAERRIAAAVTNLTSFPHYAALSADDKFDNPLSDPISVIEDGKEQVSKKLGVEPNRLVLGRDVYKSLRQHPDLLGRVQGVMVQRMLNKQQLADFFEIDEVIVPLGRWNSAKDPDTAVLDDIWGDVCILIYVDPTTGPMRARKVTPIRTFVWAGSPGGGRFAVEQYYEPQTRTNVVQCTDFTDEKVIDNDALYQFTTVIA